MMLSKPRTYLIVLTCLAAFSASASAHAAGRASRSPAFETSQGLERLRNPRWSQVVGDSKEIVLPSSKQAVAQRAPASPTDLGPIRLGNLDAPPSFTGSLARLKD